MDRNHIQLSSCNIPVVVHTIYDPQIYNYTCYFAEFPSFSGGYAFVDPATKTTISITTVLTEQLPHNSAALEYLRQNHPDLLL